MMVTAIRVSEAPYGAGEGGQAGRSRARTGAARREIKVFPMAFQAPKRAPLSGRGHCEKQNSGAISGHNSKKSAIRSKSLEQKLGHGIVDVMRVCARRRVGAGMATTAVVGSVRTINFFLLVPRARNV